MRVEIANYRGWEISFDTDKEEFYCLSNEYDNDVNKKSFSASKKYIDDYIKLNKEFKPFFVTSKDSRERKIKIVGVRKDGGLFV